MKIGDCFKTGYGPEMATMPSDANLNWNVQFGPARRPVNDLLTEGIRTARLLAETCRKPLKVLYSGGIDSEFVIHCCMQAKIDFEVTTFHFKNDLNSHDLEYVEKFKSKFKDLNYGEIEIDIEEFLRSPDFRRITAMTGCTLPHLAALMKVSLELNQPVVIGAGEPYLVNNQGKWLLRERESVASLGRFFKLNGLEGTPLFFQHTNEIFYSYLNDPVMQDLTAGRIPGKESSLTSRHTVYSRYVEIAPRPKFHGYEKLPALVQKLQAELEKEFSGMMNHRYFDYAELTQKLRPQP